MKPSDILIKALQFIEKPENWTQGAYARDIFGNDVGSQNHPSAFCFCSVGALRKASPSDYIGYRDAYNTLVKATAFRIPDFNDTHTHEEVLAMFKKAIKLAKKDENGIS